MWGLKRDDIYIRIYRLTRTFIYAYVHGPAKLTLGTSVTPATIESPFGWQCSSGLERAAQIPCVRHKILIGSYNKTFFGHGLYYKEEELSPSTALEKKTECTNNNSLPLRRNDMRLEWILKHTGILILPHKFTIPRRFIYNRPQFIFYSLFLVFG